MKYCGVCARYLAGCEHLERRKEPRQRQWELLGLYLLILGTLAYVAGGLWGLW